MLTAAQVKDLITHGMNCDFVAVEGNDGQHFEAVIVSSEFRGKTRVQQHQKVYQALGDKMRAEIHALSIKTLTPEDWAGNSNQMISEG